MREEIMEAEHHDFRELARSFVVKEISPRHPEWEAAGRVDRSVWHAAGGAGLLGTDMPAEYGGGDALDYRFNAILAEELAAAGAHAPCLPLHNDIVGPYLRTLSTDEQKERWLPGFCDGSLVTAIAITEPEAGSDIQAMRTSASREGDCWILNGSKTFISHGHIADLYLVVARTPGVLVHGTAVSASIFVVESHRAGFTRGRALDKIGMSALDTSELFFEDVAVPAENLLGRPGRAYAHLMRNLPQERLWIAVSTLAAAEKVFQDTLGYCRERIVFGQAIGRHQHNRFVLADLATSLEVARSHTDRVLMIHNDGRLSAEEAAMVKLWNTELCQNVVNRCLQLHGGYGILRENPIARAFVDTRVHTIYGGTTEIMKEIIGQSLI
ncbi:acyl-CoA dehydrogenase family protein [Amycolatopsis sp. VS8301801F10]|uniref:acyl-CoA dehydrogenase family protein n=1 Tax=Amycolatopsis sp. VS8301801F10 TaxID=2652442 RepID=UPI0038FD1A42